MRTVVVGASSGLGRCIAVGLGKRGASVALLARRKQRLVDAAKEAGPGAVGPLRRLVDLDADTWRRTFETNVTGAALVTAAAIPHLTSAVGFTRVIVGDCAGGEGPSRTEFAASWDGTLAADIAPVWVARNYLSGSLLEVEELVRVVDTVLRCGAGASIPSVAVTPRPRS